MPNRSRELSIKGSLLLGFANRFHSFALRSLLLLTGVSALLLGSGCARAFPEAQVPRMKILVMDFNIPPGLKEAPRSDWGWGPWASTIYQNPRAGVMMAERITSHLAEFPWVNLFSRVDLKYYFARKRQNLKEAYAHLQPEDIDKLMAEAPQVNFARELGADKIITGRVVRNYFSANGLINIWSSVIEIDCQVEDVATGRVEWQRHYRLRDWFGSQLSAQDELGKEMAQDLKEEYFRPMATQGTSKPLPPSSAPLP